MTKSYPGLQAGIAAILDAPVRQLLLQFAQYIVVGGLAFAVDYNVMVLLKEHVALPYQLAAAGGFICGTLANYGLCLLLVFRQRMLSQRHELLFFVAVGIAGLLLNSLLMWIGVSMAGLAYTTAKLFSAAIVLFFNFGLRRQLLFNRHSPWALRLAQWSTATPNPRENA